MTYLTQIQGHTLWRPGLKQQSLVVDLGANRGAFSKQLIERYGCRSHAFEANPALIHSMEGASQLTVYNYAVARQDGRLPFRIAANDEASTILCDGAEQATDIIHVPAIQLERLLGSLSIDAIDVLKMDIEGAEIEVLESCSDRFLSNIGQLTIEFHDFLGLTSVSSIKNTVHRLQSLGFAYIKVWQHAWGDVLFINRRWHAYSLPQILWSKYWTRNLWGFQRVLARRLASGSVQGANG